MWNRLFRNGTGTRKRAARGAVAALLLAWLAASPSPARAHDPVFGVGPHTIYRGGVEAAVALHRAEAGSERETEAALEVAYGITADWVAGVELPWVRREAGPDDASGRGDVGLFTKYRFWRRDRLGVQESAAVMVEGVFDTAREDTTPALGGGANDAVVGLAYGYEGLRWYRWAAARYRVGGDAGSLEGGDELLLDLVGGVRSRPPVYRRPDTVWLLELNAEVGAKSERDGVPLADTGGTECFLSPGIFWTLRNVAVKAGVQVPVYSDPNGAGEETDYRSRLVLEWHL